MNRTFRTPKGTDLPLLNLRGREYLEVKYRLVWFREDHPDWAIETELLSVTDNSAYARAAIKDAEGRIIATSHKSETKRGFEDYIEKAETGAIGRALALVGFGTQFCADELDEGERIVDSPVETKRPSKPGIHINQQPSAQNIQSGKTGFRNNLPANDPGLFMITFGKKYPGMTLYQAVERDGGPAVENYLNQLKELCKRDGKPLWPEAVRFEKALLAYKDFLSSNHDEASDELLPPDFSAEFEEPLDIALARDKS